MYDNPLGRTSNVWKSFGKVYPPNSYYGVSCTPGNPYESLFNNIIRWVGILYVSSTIFFASPTGPMCGAVLFCQSTEMSPARNLTMCDSVIGIVQRSFVYIIITIIYCD